MLRLRYRGELMQRVETAHLSGQPHARVMNFPVGRGRLIWSPLPVELAEPVETTVALYRYALGQAGIAPAFALGDNDPAVLVYPARYREATLYAVVSELGSPASLRLTDHETGTGHEVDLPAGRSAMWLIRRTDGLTLGSFGTPAAH